MELLERASFLATLAEYAAEARGGDGRLVLVSGESGIGKTVLLEAFRHEHRRDRWLWGACDPLLTPRPLGPLFDIGPQAGGELAELCRAGAPRDQLFAALLDGLSASGPFTVVVVEDLHWADEATVDLLSFLGRRLGRLPTLLLATYRDDELAEDHPLRLALGDLATQRATRRMRLPALTVSAVQALVGERELDPAELHRVTGGNPFYVTEVLAAGWPSVPATVRDAVGARLARAAPAARRALEVAALIGTRVDRGVLSAVLAGSGGAEDCLGTGMVEAEGEDLRFRHELVRMAVEAAIGPLRGRSLHTSVLAALEERGGADPAVLAHHAEGAGAAAAVLRYAPAAAARSAALGAHREAAAQFARALRWAGDRDAADRAPLHEGLAGEYSRLDRWEEAERELRTALALRTELGDEVRAAEDWQQLSTTLWRLCRGEESERAAEAAVRILEPRSADRELAAAYLRLGAARWNRGRAAAGLDAVDRGRRLGEALSQADVVSSAAHALGMIKARSGQDGTPLVERALEIALDAGLADAAGNTYSSLQEAAVLQHRFADAERYFAAGTAFCERRELGVFTVCLKGWRGRALLLVGRWDEATTICAGLLARRGVSPVNRLNPLCVLGAVRGRRAEAGAWDCLDEALALAEGTGEPLWIATVRLLRAEMRWLAGQSGLAAEEAGTGFAAARDGTDPWTRGSLAVWLTRLGRPGRLPAAAPEPFLLEAAAEWGAAADEWDRLGRPYDAALARLGGSDEAGLRGALATFERLNAGAAATVARRRMRELGIRPIPRGPRPATRGAPAGLTAREREVLALLAEGLPDREISDRLVVSERTVHHHVSAVLAKIGVTSRTAAAREATRLGIGSRG